MENSAAYSSKSDFDAAVDSALAAATAYYNGDTPLMTDAEYDQLLDRITASVAANPNWDAKTLLTSVAAGTAQNGTVPHPSPMLSLTKATDGSELRNFLHRLNGAATVTEVKIDGMAIRAVYEGGQLAAVITRGDGLSGEDVTAQAQSVAGLPAKLTKKVDLEVRGEVFMNEENFLTATTNRVAAGKAPFVNPRNATAGTLRNADPTYEAPLSFAAYEAHGDILNHLDSHTARMETLSTLNIVTAQSLVATINAKDNPATTIEQIHDLRHSLGFPIDGVVVKADSVTNRETLGVMSRAPKWAIAWKYPADAAESILRDIEVTIGRTGRMALTAIIDPVFVAGATVSRATLHNVDFVTQQNLGIGSRLAVVRANDVIPRVTALIGDQDDNVTPWEPPATCPTCDQPWNTDGVLWRCQSASCSTVAAITYWASRDCLDIDRLGETICEALVTSGHVADVADLYTLTVNDIADLNLNGRVVGASHAQEIISGIEQSKTQPFNRVITGLGIRMTGRSVGRWLAAEFHTMAALRAAGVDDIARIEKLGPLKAASIAEGLLNLAPVIDRLAAAGVNMGSAPTPGIQNSLPLEGKTYVVSGAVPGYTRTTIQERIEHLGGKASSSVSKTTTALVTSETTTSKAVKAAELGIPIIDPSDFAELIR